MLRRWRTDDGATGQAMAEFALVVPLFFAMLFGVIDLGRVIWANDALANAAREGARYASVHAGTVQLTTLASKSDIRTHTMNFANAGGQNLAVTVCFSSVKYATAQLGCSGDTDEAGAGYQRGNLVTVVVTSDVPVLTGSLLGFGTFRVSGSSTVLINN